MKKQLLFILIFFAIPAFSYAEWDIHTSDCPYTKVPGDTFSVYIELSGSGNNIDAMGMDFHFLDYVQQEPS